jgi:hypothetical protein
MTTLPLRYIKGDFVVTGRTSSQTGSSHAERPRTGAWHTNRARPSKRSVRSTSPLQRGVTSVDDRHLHHGGGRIIGRGFRADPGRVSAGTEAVGALAQRLQTVKPGLPFSRFCDVAGRNAQSQSTPAQRRCSRRRCRYSWSRVYS